MCVGAECKHVKWSKLINLSEPHNDVGSFQDTVWRVKKGSLTEQKILGRRKRRRRGNGWRRGAFRENLTLSELIVPGCLQYAELFWSSVNCLEITLNEA